VFDCIAVILLGIIEGITEFLPISSTGHLLIAERWLPRQSDLFNIVIQCGAVLAVVPLFQGRWQQLFQRWREPATRDFFLKILFAFCVTGVGGLILEKKKYKLPEELAPVAWAMLIGGVLFLLVERWIRGRPLRQEVTWMMALAVGIGQLIAAVFPGTSRSGATILLVLLLGLTRPLAAEFSFIVGIPTMLAAGGLKIFKSLHHSAGGAIAERWGLVLLGTLVAAVVSFVVVRWLLRYVQTHTFIPFGWYRIGLGALIFGLFLQAAGIHTVAGTGQPGYDGDGGPATRARINNPYGLCKGPDGALYFCDMENHAIRRIGRDQTISTVAGTGKRGYSGDGGPALKAEINEPYEVRFDRAGNMYFVEMKNHLVRRVDAKTRIISTVAGIGQPGFSGDGGPAQKATFNQPHSIQLDRNGNLFICDIGNNRVRKVDLQSGVVTTFAGSGEKGPTRDGASFASVPLNGPRAIDFDPQGNLWLALREGNAVYKLDLKAGTIHHIAGNGSNGFTGNGGPAKAASLAGPKGLSVGPDGNIYIADTESHSIRRINPRQGKIDLIAGTGLRGDGPDGDPLQCRMARPHGIFVDDDGRIFVSDSEAHRVRSIH
jgi:undecaprenyl-diphosphatase UppP